MRLWEKGKDINAKVLDFTVGEDHRLDLRLIKYDCLASQAHARMLSTIGVLTEPETKLLTTGLSEIIKLHEKGQFNITKEQEDCHTAIEEFLTEKCGAVGKKIHLGRSRNDQVLTALRLFEKDSMEELKKALIEFIKALTGIIKNHGSVPIPGYTHMRKAMPATVEMWLGSFISAVEDDLLHWESVYRLIDQSPLGTAAGFGTPVFDLDRKQTARALGFSRVQENSMYAQFSRGKFEMSILGFLSGIMLIINKLATDLLLFSMQEFGYIELPEEFCTGSSIMPQKKNPDVLELLRAKYSIVLGEEFKLKSLAGNLMSGYNRDLQLTKKPLFTALDTTLECLDIMAQVLPHLEVNKEKCEAAMSSELFATEKAYELVKSGLSFREAYRKVSDEFSKE